MPDAPVIGMGSLPEKGGLDEHAALCRELGLSFVELNMDLPAFQPDRLDAASLRFWQDKGVGFTLHLPERLDMLDFIPRVREAWTQTALDAAAFAAEAGIPVLNMHLPAGVYFTLPDRRLYLYEEYEEECLPQLLRFRGRMEEALRGRALLAVENTGGYTAAQGRMLDRLLESPAFCLCLDVGHDHGTGGGDGAFILKRRERLRHMHLHDALGRRDHLALGQGELDVEALLNLAKERSCRVVLEVKREAELRSSVQYLRARGWL